MNFRTTLQLPREHGAWAMLSVPFLIGVLVGGGQSWRVLWLGLAMTFVFIAREPLLLWQRARRRGKDSGAARRLVFIYFGLAALFSAPLLVFHHLFGLVLLGLLVMILLGVNTWQAGQREDRTVLGESLAILGLTLTAPAAHYVARGRWEVVALWLWALSALYFTSSVFYVKLRVLESTRKEQARKQAWRHCALYHASLSISLVVLALTSSVYLFALVAFAPALLRAFWSLLKPAGQLNLRRIGVMEICYSLVFLIFMAIAFRG
jgi:hypothetical protein